MHHQSGVYFSDSWKPVFEGFLQRFSYGIIFFCRTMKHAERWLRNRFLRNKTGTVYENSCWCLVNLRVFADDSHCESLLLDLQATAFRRQWKSKFFAARLWPNGDNKSLFSLSRFPTRCLFVQNQCQPKRQWLCNGEMFFSYKTVAPLSERENWKSSKSSFVVWLNLSTNLMIARDYANS